MKIHELEIKNLRGIRHLQLKPDGENFLISGPNGSGKSAIVDAIDLLLTGDISRMKGKGTKGITLNKHGPHIDAKPKDSCVRAIVKLQGIEEPFEIKRNLKDKKLIIDSAYLDDFKPVLELASRGQHVLTRREILNFVTAEAGTRASQVQKLLKLDDVEEHRKKLNNVLNKLKNQYKNSERNLGQAEADISVSIGQETLTPENLLEFINQQRSILGGDAVNEVNYGRLKEEITPPASRRDSRLNSKLLENDLENIQKITNHKDFETKDARLRELIVKFHSSPTFSGAAKKLRITRLGLELLDDKGKCPLCDKSWEPSELKEHLDSRLKIYQDAKDDLEELEKLSNDLLGCINRLKASIQEMDQALVEWELDEEKLIFQRWTEDLKELAESLTELEKYPLEKFSPEKIANLLAPRELPSITEKIQELLTDIEPEITPEQLAWDKLTRLEEKLELYEKKLEEYHHDLKSYNQAEILLKAFQESREKILNQLYTEIKDRFVELYRELHEIDEKQFEATLTSSGAGIDFQVDFHGRGENPPHALHSEGHQDSMGICLYLALAEQLTQGYIDLIVLDDVMMSVDAPHRRKICHLLANFFKGKQFFITTHDQTWARQLQSEGVIKSKNRVELSNWTIENGPMVNSLGDMWERIEEDLKKNDVPAAAARLRRGSEEYFTQVCTALQAPVKYKPTGQHDLGDLLNGGVSAYKKILKQAKYSARHWEKFEELAKLEEIDEYSKDVLKRTNMERWAVNPAVHFNHWAEFTPEDFRPVVNAFDDLYTLFKCEQCGTFLHLTLKDNQQESVKCDCNRINWNLKGK